MSYSEIVLAVIVLLQWVQIFSLQTKQAELVYHTHEHCGLIFETEKRVDRLETMNHLEIGVN